MSCSCNTNKGNESMNKVVFEPRATTRSDEGGPAEFIRVPDGMSVDQAIQRLAEGGGRYKLPNTGSSVKMQIDRDPAGLAPLAQACGPSFPDNQLVCRDANEYLCVGSMIVPSIFYVFYDRSKPALPLAGTAGGSAWVDGDFRTLGTFQRLRSCYDTWTGSEPHTSSNGLIPSGTAVGGALPFPVYQTAAPATNIFSTTEAPLMGFATTFGLLNVSNRPQFNLQIDTTGFQTRNRNVAVDRTGVTITVLPWMYDAGFIVTLFGLRVKTETGLFMASAHQTDPAKITLTFPTNVVSSVIPTVIGLQPDADMTMNAMVALHNLGAVNYRAGRV